jgi:hypothetical protein
MATINIGSIKFKWKGTYNALTAYTVDDVVEYNGSSYICILASTGNLPTNATYFEQMSQKGTDADLLNIASTAQGDIYYNNGGAIARLGAGTSGQVLKTQGAGANPIWGADEGGKILQVQNMITQSSMATTSSSYVVTALTDTITPSATSSKILLLASGNLNQTTSGQWVYATIFRDGSNIAIDNDGFNGIYSAGGDTHTPFNVHYLDSPNSTSSLTYDIRIRVGGGNGRFNHEQNTSSLTLIEIGA